MNDTRIVKIVTQDTINCRVRDIELDQHGNVKQILKSVSFDDAKNYHELLNKIDKFISAFQKPMIVRKS